jgi:hypothetical protein
MDYDTDAYAQCRAYYMDLISIIDDAKKSEISLQNLLLPVKRMYTCVEQYGASGSCFIRNPSDHSLAVTGHVEKSEVRNGVELRKISTNSILVDIKTWERDLGLLADELIVGCYHALRNNREDPAQPFDPVAQLKTEILGRGVV